MKLFQSLLGGASSSNGLFGFLCFFNPMFSENEFFFQCSECSPFRSTWNTGYITGLDMCKVCTEAVQSVAL